MIKSFHRINFNILWVLLSALVFRLFLSNFGTLQLDHGTFIAWANNLSESGLSDFYNNWSDYFPGYLYILWFLGKVNLFIPYFQTILFKLPSIFADLAIGYLIYKIAGANKKGVVFSLLYLFNPAIFANSSLWGQVDSLTALFSILSIYLFPINYLLSAVTLAIGTLIKPQAAFILPAILYMIIKNKISFSKVLSFGVLGFGVFILGFIPFNNKLNLVGFIFDRFNVSANQYPFGSINAFSFWGLFGFWKPDEKIIWVGVTVSIVLIALIGLISLKRKIKIPAGEYLIAGVSFLTTFMFVTRMHERHLLPALAPLLIASVYNPLLLISYLILSLTYISNLTYSYYWITDNFKEIFNPTLIKIMITANLVGMLVVFGSIFKKIKLNIKFGLSKLKAQSFFEKKDIPKKTAKLLLVLIILFGFGTRIYYLNIPKEMYFDEIYHAFTARLVYKGDPKAWEWWNPHPEGFAYEWTHPPLSKLGMALGMIILGNNSLGWRFPQAIIGTFSILLIYLLTKSIFRDRWTSLLAAFLFSLEGLPLVLSRMGMNDSYLLFFSILSIYLLIKDKPVFSAVAFGLAIASKWSAIYTLPILIVTVFAFRKKITYSYLSFLFIPLLVYVSSYGIMFKTGHTWNQFVEVQKQMWWYHTNLKAEHPYTSPAWSWPLNLRPVYLYDGQTTEGKIARIYAFGNPVILWFGLFSVIFIFIIAYKERIKKLGFIVFCYLIFFLPWIASPRIMFFYHYLPSLPFLTMASAYVLRRFSKIQYAFLAFAFIAFVYFYPHWIGMRIPLWLDESYYWFNSWR